MTVPTVTLAEGLTVSAQGYGAMSVAPVYGPVDPAEALATLHHAVDIGITFIDTPCAGYRRNSGQFHP